MASEYIPGSIAKILSAASDVQQRNVQHSKLHSLFQVPAAEKFNKSAGDLKVTKKVKISSKAESDNSNQASPTKKRKRKIDVGSQLVLDREESIRNADEENKPKKKKQKPSKTSNEEVDGEDKKDEELLSNSLRAKRRIEAKQGRRIRKKDPETDGRTVFVGNVAITVDKKKLLKLFRPYGEIDSIRFRSVAVPDLKLPKKAAAITKAFHPQRHNMNAYVVFKDKQNAVEAKQLNGTELDGLHLHVDVEAEKKLDHNRSVFIGNLSYQTEEENVRNHFIDCGQIENVRIIRDSKTGMGKGIGYLLFKDSASVDLALLLNGHSLDGRELRVQRSLSNPVKTPSSKKQGKDKSVNPRSKGDKKKFSPKKSASNSTSLSESKPKKPKIKKSAENKSFDTKNNFSSSSMADKKRSRKKEIRRKSRERQQRSLGRLLLAQKST